MKTSAVPSSWLQRDGRRLDCGPYMSGALEARVLLERLNAPTAPLSSLTSGHKGGIYNGPQFKRNYVDDPNHGVPFLTGGDVLSADIDRLPLLSRRDANSAKLNFLRLTPGMTIISCSGAIGRMAFVRPDMDGVWSSQDVIKVVPDRGKIPPGYLYAYLSCKFGVPLIVGGTYGAIIQHIEPEHIASIPVPRLGKEFEDRVHFLVEESSRIRANAQALLNGATATLLERADLEDWPDHRWHAAGPDLAFASHPSASRILRALPYNPRFQRILNELGARRNRTLAEICERGHLGTGVRFKRVDCDEEFGVRLVGQREGFWTSPQGRWISAARAPRDIFAKDETVMLASSGTLGENEVYCRALFVTGPWLDYAYTQHFFRIVSSDAEVPGAYLFAFLRSNLAFRCLRCMSTGSKQQEIHRDLIARFPIPLLSNADIRDVSERVRTAFERRFKADFMEQEAVSLVEVAVSGGAN